jgi:hypothetical protein
VGVEAQGIPATAAHVHFAQEAEFAVFRVGVEDQRGQLRRLNVGVPDGFAENACQL